MRSWILCFSIKSAAYNSLPAGKYFRNTGMSCSLFTPENYASLFIARSATSKPMDRELVAAGLGALSTWMNDAVS